jgi:hypothetical protein
MSDPTSPATLWPGRPATPAPKKIKPRPKPRRRKRGPFLHDHPVAAPGLKGHTKPVE